jgi:hypothetical protein
MTSEELIEAGVPQAVENVPQSMTSQTTEVVRESSSREDGEIRSENRSEGGEDLSNVEVNLNELISSKGSYPPVLVFRKYKVSSELIKEYEEVGFFPSGDGRPPSEEETPSPEADEIVVYMYFFICGLIFLCDTLLLARHSP